MTQTPVQRGFWFHVVDVVFNIVVIVAIVAGIRTFLVSPFQVEGNSMVSTLEDREYIVINKLAYFLGNPVRGDIVVFRPPNDSSKFYVKRIIGIPGDTIEIRDGNVYVRSKEDESFHKLSESYLDERNNEHTFRHPPNSGDTTPITYDVPDGQYFVLGDNRQGSHDSRSFTVDGADHPFVLDQNIKGRVWFVALPLSKIHAFSLPTYDL